MPGEIIFRLIITGLILIVFVIIFIRFRNNRSKGDGRDSLDVMKERMKKGEITREDYEEAKRRRGKV